MVLQSSLNTSNGTNATAVAYFNDFQNTIITGLGITLNGALPGND